MAEEQQEEADIHRPRELYAYHATSSFATDISMSYFSYFAVRLGASFELLAWMQSLNNLLPNTLQHFWGWISDRRVHRAFWIIIGSVLGGFALWLLSQAQTPEEVLALLVLYSASLSLVQPTWAALQGDWIPAGRRGRVLSRFHVVGGMAGLIGSLVALWFVYNSGNETADGFRPLFVMAAA
ncbi:MAG TPA: MFS transporter, partial [Candidatus Poseidoniia archaeon]|nr:MFS transporter [Candidatus Poseidoniia archaeon]